MFKGIRYATAERHAPPRPVATWDGVRDAIDYGAQCHQIPGLLERALGASSLPMAEECLTLNVVTPGCDDGGRHGAA